MGTTATRATVVSAWTQSSSSGQGGQLLSSTPCAAQSCSSSSGCCSVMKGEMSLFAQAVSSSFTGKWGMGDRTSIYRVFGN